MVMLLEKLKSQFDPAAMRFVGLFFLFVLGLTLIIQIPWVDQRVIGPYTEFLAAVGGWLLNQIGSEVQVLQTVIRQGSFAVDIKRGCDGVVATILLVSACLAYPSSWKNRLFGTAFGYALIFLLNMLRIVGLFLIGLRGSLSTFNFFHVYVSQFAVIALTMVFWVLWAGRQRASVGD